MAAADTQAYYRRMLPQIEAGASRGTVVAGATTELAQCRADIGGTDNTYVGYCPSPWLRVRASPSANSAQLVFAKNYFEWAQAYVAVALRAKPPGSASAQLRVVWALDVWAHVQYALWALNLCWADWRSGGGLVIAGGPIRPPVQVELQPTTGMYGVANALARDLEGFYADAEVQRAKDASTGPGQFVGQGDVGKVPTVVAPAPFMTHTIFWTLAESVPDKQSANNLWGLLLRAVQPWASNWGTYWLGSKGGKDTAEVRQYEGDPVMIRALMQWRLWSARDHFNRWDTGRLGKAFWPRGMGQGNDCVTLTEYIGHVAKASGDKTYFASYAYPTFRQVFDSGIQRLAFGLARIDYDQVVMEQAATWAVSATPKLNPDGTPRTVDQQRATLGLAPLNDHVRGETLTAQPVTYPDYRDALKGLQDALVLRAQIAMRNPELLCAPEDGACRKAAEMSKDFQAKAAEIPVMGALMNGMYTVSDWLVKTFGAGMGNVYVPFAVLRNPFARTLIAQGYDMAANGSTASVFARVSIAAMNTGKLAGIGAAVPASSGPPRPQFVDDRCIANCPSAPSAGEAALQRGADIRTACFEQWEAAKGTIPGWDCLDPDKAMMVYVTICQRRELGQLNPLQAMGEWLAYVKGQCDLAGRPEVFAMPSALPPRPTVWQGFMRGVLAPATVGHRLPEFFVRR